MNCPRCGTIDRVVQIVTCLLTPGIGSPRIIGRPRDKWGALTGI